MMAGEADLRKLLSMAGVDPNRVTAIGGYIQGAAKEGVEEKIPSIVAKIAPAALPKIQPFVIAGLGISLLALIFALKASKLNKSKDLAGHKPSGRLSRARAFYRLAAKAERAGQYTQGEQYRKIAERLVAEDRREGSEWLARSQRESRRNKK
jgi:hypothetical protein